MTTTPHQSPPKNQAERLERLSAGVDRWWHESIARLEENLSDGSMRLHTIPDEVILAAVTGQSHRIREHGRVFCRVAEFILRHPVYSDDERNRFGEGPMSIAELGMVDWVNALQCSGVDIDPAIVELARDWITKIHVPHDKFPDRMHYHWGHGMAALAFDRGGDLRYLYRPIAGHFEKEAIAFQPGETFQWNMQAFLAHLAAAVERDTSVADVTPGWRSVVAWFPMLEQAKFMGYETMLWAARIVHHRIAGAPLGEVADWLHAELVRSDE